MLLLLASASRVEAQATLINGLGGIGYGASCLGRNDDGSSRAIDMRPVFPTGIQFFDRTHTQMYVNTNGNITFSGGLPTFTPNAFPVANQPMIAPFWADVDIRGSACLEPDGGSGFAGNCQNPTENGVWWTVDSTNRRIVVTWDRVGYYDCKVDKRMTFQLILTPVDTASCGGGDFDVEFRFNRCEWNTGDASGGLNGLSSTATCDFGTFCPLRGITECTGGTCHGVPAQAGFDAGNTRDFVEIMGSRTNTIQSALCTGSNVGLTGVWRFQIRRGVVICPGAGLACDTGMPGVCGAGRTQCVGGGTECRPEVTSSAERCDALDNDCDGMTDEGSDLCPINQVCDRGTCISNCFEGGCSPGQTCTENGCVDAACASVTCPDGQRCVEGACVDACNGVVCPGNLACRAGQCVDPCAGAVCDDCTVCVDGGCATRCQFSTCPGGMTCMANGTCMESACASVSCPSGQMCRSGSCVDACQGAVCPDGQMCQGGSCVAEVIPDAGPYVYPDGGPRPEYDGGISVVDSGVDAGPRHRGPYAPGCTCRAATPTPSPLFGFGALFVLGVLVRRRRR
jgi:MYXO-CTERM domain-containing protein